MKSLLPIFALCIFLTSCATQQPEESDTCSITTLIFVRHAEKANDGSENPPLANKGEARAALLRDMLVSSGVDAIYSTPYRRTMSTVQPLADSLGVDIIEYDPSLGNHAFVDGVLNEFSGKRVVICGHSNTVPGMLNILVGEERYAQLSDGDYDNLYIVSVLEMGDAEVLNLQFHK